MQKPNIFAPPRRTRADRRVSSLTPNLLVERAERYSDARGLSRNTVRKYLRSASVEPKFTFLRARACWTITQTSCCRCGGRKRGKSRKQKRTDKQLHAPLTFQLTGLHCAVLLRERR